MRKLLSLLLWLFLVSTTALAQEKTKPVIYQLNIKEDISPKVWRDTQHAFAEADSLQADLMLIHMNTYGGLVSSADSIRTKILNSSIPVYVFIDNNAASAGALISIACDSIYMRKGGSIGAASVVNQSGEKMPDKYQSYMRATMRATAEHHGGDTIVVDGKTQINWHRNPLMAEAMVDERVVVPDLVDSTQILTFTPAEAMKHGFCEGTAESVGELLEQVGYPNCEPVEYTPSLVEKIIGFLVNPMVSGILIMAIIGGIYYEMQSPGLGFPILVALLAATAYFAPLYLEGLAAHWEILLFVVGLILIALEIFVIPGFGVAGISGIALALGGLTLSLLYNVEFDFQGVSLARITSAVSVVFISVTVAIIGSLYLTTKIFGASKGPFSRLTLHAEQTLEEGYVGVDTSGKSLVGELAVAATVLRPSGKVRIGKKHYDAVAIFGFVDQGVSVKIVRQEAAQLYVEAVSSDSASE